MGVGFRVESFGYMGSLWGLSMVSMSLKGLAMLLRIQNQMEQLKLGNIPYGIQVLGLSLTRKRMQSKRKRKMKWKRVRYRDLGFGGGGGVGKYILWITSAPCKDACFAEIGQIFSTAQPRGLSRYYACRPALV